MAILAGIHENNSIGFRNAIAGKEPVMLFEFYASETVAFKSTAKGKRATRRCLSCTERGGGAASGFGRRSVTWLGGA